MKWAFDFELLFTIFLLLCFLPFGFPFFSLQLPKVLLSAIMSSFLSDSTIDLGGSDFGGSTKQPIMDRDVISICSSSFEDTRYGAPDSESSSSKRVRASHQTSGSSSRPREGVRPSVAVGEPIPLTMILPPSAFGGVRRSSSGGDVRVFRHV